MKISKKDKERFLSKVNVGGPDDCWEWSGYTDKEGYGRFRFQDKNQLIHRIIYLWFFGKIPKDLCVFQSCGNRLCVNPVHLMVGTRTESHHCMSGPKTVFRFWDKVNKCGEDECWEWQARLNSTGYGEIRVEGKTWLAHRRSYLLKYGEIPDGLCVLHKCDNPKCVNPKHLFLGTQSDNVQDMVKKGRDTRKISGDQAKKIRELYSVGKSTSAQLAEKYGVSQTTIFNVFNRKHGH